MKNKKLPHEHHVVRYVPFGKLRKDEDDNPIGILGAAFELRDGEPYLSTTWLEYFAGSRSDQITAAIQAVRASRLSVSAKSGFAIGRIGAIATACAEHRHGIRIIHEPEDDNHAHAAVRRMPRNDDELLELLAAESMIAYKIEWFSEYEIVMASAEPKPTPNLAPSTRTP
jgi:hypothetical protein